MDRRIEEYLGSLQLGEALGGGSIEIRKVSERESVPELREVNRAGKMVLNAFNQMVRDSVRWKEQIS